MANEKKKILNNVSIPVDWEMKEIGNLASLISGMHLNPDDYNKTNEGLPYFTGPTDYTNNENEITKWTTKKSAIAQSGDTLITVKGSGVGSLHQLEINTVSIGRQVMALRSKSSSHNLFIYYSLANKEFHFQELGKGNMIPGLSRPDILKTKIKTPPLPEQRAIAQVLSLIDRAINTNNQLIAQKELRKKWLMQELLTGKRRLPAFAKAMAGEDGWKEYSYEKLLKVVKRNFDWNENEQYKLISVRRRSGGIFFREALYGHQILVKTLRTAKEGDFLFSKMQILHGASALVTKEFDGAKISGSYIAVVAKDDQLLNMEFFQWYSQIPYFYHQTYISSYGVHIEKMTFDFETFLQLEMKLPSFEEQTAIAQVLQTADKEIHLLKAKTERLKEQKKGMMQQLLTGKKRLTIQ
jgi:type I restriction enzyme S subunit